ncbi:SpoIIE family protein phosphatase [Streptomyces sp. NPDC093260]|uniref:SpoIIE family protein phosphatase n=1 Tax=Streptomyces sp. NPDC093260 TaxID=3155073 RepID=UPI00343345DF
MESHPTPPDGHGNREPPVAGVRPEILASWQRSHSLGIDQEGVTLPVERDLDPDSRLLRAAAPVLDRLRRRFTGLPVTIALADSHARLVDRRGDPAGLDLMDAASLVPGANVDERFMGTSSVSMVLSTRAPFVVVGQEHFLHNLKELTCMAAPVRDPVGGGVQGAVNLSVPRMLGEPGMALVLQDATERIGERLLKLSTARERELMRSFHRARRVSGAVHLHIGSGELLRPGGPAPELSPQERMALLERAIELISASGEAYAEVPLAGGRVALLRRRELQHGEADGAAVEVGFVDRRGGASGAVAVTATAPDGREVPLLGLPDPSAGGPAAAGLFAPVAPAPHGRERIEPPVPGPGIPGPAGNGMPAHGVEGTGVPAHGAEDVAPRPGKAGPYEPPPTGADRQPSSPVAPGQGQPRTVTEPDRGRPPAITKPEASGAPATGRGEGPPPGAEPGGSPPSGAEPPASPLSDAEPADRWLLLVGEPGVGRIAAEARGRLSLLNEAGVRLGTSLDMRRTAEELAKIAVPGFADLVVVDLVESALTGEEPPLGRPWPEAGLRRVAAWAGEEYGDTSVDGVDRPVEYPVGTPQARCLETEGPVADSVPTAALAGLPARGVHPVELLGEGVHHYLGAPLCARGCLLGLAGFYRRGGERPFEQDDLTLAGELAARAAISVDNARHYRREHQASLTLQRSLLPRALPRVSAVGLASRYLPADARAGVGGDWFDAIPLSGMRVALVVGDVPGNGLQAAATMGRLRTAVQTLARQDLLPEEVLTHLDDLVSHTLTEPDGSPDGEQDPATGATCLYAVYDPVSCRCTAARAGHPPPALLPPDGEARLLDLPAGPPLGLGGMQPYESATVEVPAGSLLALYTDGLLKEERGYGDTDARLSRLLASLDESGPALEDVCEGVTRTLLPGGPHDDVALLLARVHALPEDRVASWEFASDPSVVARARAVTSAQLAAWGMAELEASTSLVVSELVTNAVRYGGQGPVGLRLLRGDSLICEVSDRSNSSPRIRRAATTEEGGRGLFLVAQYTKSWGARYMRQGKTVWAEQAPHGGPAEPEIDEQALLDMFDDLD